MRLIYPQRIYFALLYIIQPMSFFITNREMFLSSAVNLRRRLNPLGHNVITISLITNRSKSVLNQFDDLLEQTYYFPSNRSVWNSLEWIYCWYIFDTTDGSNIWREHKVTKIITYYHNGIPTWCLLLDNNWSANSTILHTKRQPKWLLSDSSVVFYTSSLSIIMNSDENVP